MKKYVTAVLISIAMTEIITGCGHEADIGKDKAAQIALDDANLSESDVTRLRVSKDRDDGETIYEIKFTNENTEYEYEVLASNGNILSSDYEEAYPSDQPNQDTQKSQNNSQSQDTQPAPDDSQESGSLGNTTQPEGSQANTQITLEEASKLALDRVPGASAQDLKIELDYDDGQYKYEGDIIFEQKEYEFEIDANTGEFLEWKEERR